MNLKKLGLPDTVIQAILCQDAMQLLERRIQSAAWAAGLVN